MVTSGSTQVVTTGVSSNSSEKRTRSRNGCFACRRTRVRYRRHAPCCRVSALTIKVKCDETHPICGRCSDREQGCEWPTDPDGPVVSTSRRKHRNPRPVSSCDSCRVKKLKCDATYGSTCRPCTTRRISCTWSGASERRGSSTQRPTVSSSSSLSRSASPASRHQSVYVGSTTSLHPFGPATSAAPAPFVFPQPSITAMSASATAAPESTLNASSDGPGPPSQAISTNAAASAAQITPLSLAAPVPAEGFGPPPTSNLAKPGLSSSTYTSDRMRDLIRVFFATVHNFGFLSFIHEGDFWDRYEQSRIPDTLCQLMAASALRRAPSMEDLSLADAWASEAGDKMLASVFKEFGVVDLMELVLCHHYDFMAGRYSRGWIMAGMAVRMMTFLRLHILDETPHPSPKPFLSLETLRRLAWSVWFLDATLDGGNFGFSTIGDGAITIQLPSDERPFLLHQSVTTEPLMPRDAASQNATLGLAAHLIRAMHARQILADAHSRIQRKLIPRDSIADLVRHTSNEARAILDTLPPEMRYSRIQYHAYRDQRSMLVHLHVMRNTCERHLGLLRMLSLEHASPELQGASGLTDIGLDGDDQRAHEAQDIRKRLIADAIALSGIMSDALAYEVIFDPQMAMHSYNGIEVLLFQPMRQAMARTEVSISRVDAAKCLKPLLEVVRGLAAVSNLVALIRPEAVNRMIRMAYVDDLTNDDIMAVLHKVHSLANVDTEFDFNESFWRYELSLTRSSTQAQPAPGSNHPTRPTVAESPNDRLLETNSEVSPNHQTEPAALARATGGTASDRLTVHHLLSTSSQPRPSVSLPTVSGNFSAHEDPLTRLHTFLATNSRRNSFSGANDQSESTDGQGGQAAGALGGTSGYVDGYDFDFGFGFGLGVGDDLSTLLTNGMRGGSGLGVAAVDGPATASGSTDPSTGWGGLANNGWPEGLPRQWRFGD